MLGLVHRTVLDEGPPHFKKWFFRKNRARPYNTRQKESVHHLQLHDHVNDSQTELLRRSALGLPRVYNGLPTAVVSQKTVSAFQKALQELVLTEAKKGKENWEKLLSPRLSN